MAAGAVAFAAFGLLTGASVGALLSEGFRFDWYVHAPLRALPPGTLVSWAARVAAGTALVAAPAGVLLAYRTGTGGVPAGGSRARRQDVHLIGLTLLAPPLAALIAWIGATLALLVGGDGPLPGVHLPAALGATGALTGIFVHACACRGTARALAAGRLIRPPPGENLLALIMLHSARHRGRVLAAILAVTLLSGYGLTLVTTDVDVADVLPRGDPNTAAAHNLTDRFKSSFTQQVTFHARVNPQAHAADEAAHTPGRVTDSEPGNITDEVYVRAVDQMIDFLKGYVPPGHAHPPFEGSVALPGFYRLMNWTIAGGIHAPNASYALPSPDTPQDAARFRLVHDGVWRVIPDAASALVSPDFEQTAILATVDPKAELSSREIGEAALLARDAYVAWATSEPDAYKAFTGDNAPRFTVDLPLANAHESELTEQDFSFLLPAIAVYIALCLWFAFRDTKLILVAFSSLGISVAWTFGAMGLLGIPMNPLNLTVVPLIMGVGIDYGIHLMNDYQHGRSRGLPSEDAFRHAGSRTGISLFIATATSICGLAVMMVSPSLLIAQLGLLSAIALAAMFGLMVTYVPALTTVLAPRVRRHDYRPSPLMANAARWVGRRRGAAVAVTLVLAGAALASSTHLHTEPFGDPPRNWPADDPLRNEHEAAAKGFYDTDRPDGKANVLVFEGDIVDPAAHRYMDAIEASLRTKPRVIDDTLRTVPFLLRTYLAIREGAPGALQYQVLEGLATQGGVESADPYPDSREEVEAIMDEVQGTPLFEFANLFYDYPDNSMGIMTFTARAASFEDAAEVWDQVWAAIDANEHLRPSGLRVAFVGNTATNYLFVAKEVPWLGYMSVAVSVAVVALVYLIARDARAALTVGALNVATSLLWVGLLPPLGIGLAITLTLPLVFIFAMGSDYGLHLALACRDEGDTAHAFGTTGKAILYSFVTTFGAFLIFTRVSNLAVQRTMLATAVAIIVIFVTTLLIVPSAYPAKPPGKDATGHADEAEKPAPAPRLRG